MAEGGNYYCFLQSNTLYKFYYLTNEVLLTIHGCMNGFSTITQKGQVGIPKSIRDYSDLKPFDRIRFTIHNNMIVVYPVTSINDMLGIFSAKKTLSKQEYKTVIKKRVLKKYAHRS